MTVAHPPISANPNAPQIIPGTLRARLTQLQGPLPLDTAVSVLVAVGTQVSEVHAQGYGLYLHGSSVVQDAEGGFRVSTDLATHFPTHPRDRACMPPEAREGQLNDQRANVYALGAMLYELLTGATVGAGMRHPRELNPALPEQLETILAAALITDPAQRPADLPALVQAIHQLCQPGTVPPPPSADGFDLEVDVSLSMLPPAPSGSVATVQHNNVQHSSAQNDAGQPGGSTQNGFASAAISAGMPISFSSNAYGVSVAQAPAPQQRTDDATQKLAELKARLESDPRPRYVVVKDGMDHGPFNAVELLHQIGNHTFAGTDELRDETSGEQLPIEAWEDFAPFADHAQRHREIQEEKAAIVRVAHAESKSTRSKAILGTLLLSLLLGGGVIAFMRFSGMRSDDVKVHADSVTNVESDGAIAAEKKRGYRGSGKGTSSGGRVVAAGQSCQGAIAAYKGDSIDIGGGKKKGPADLTAGQYGAILNRGTYLNSCGVPSNMSVSICAAVQNGRAVGVSVSTTPHNAAKASCVSRYIRGITFPSRPNLDVTRTSFAAQ